MKVTVVRGGGFGLVTTSSVDSASLPDQDAEALRAAVERSGILEGADLAPVPRHPDAQAYTLTVQDRGATRSVQLRDPLPEGIRSLIAWIDSAPGVERQITPPTEA